ncbi:hypothetical protein V6N12_012922 [Hibiscus sabdariffa]|uniref:Uncharacterized protein n=1 Tax=Hibiscus sabdariffa TaxID=183260 RepID=A0ABR2EFT7_9ROSI
MWGSWIHFRLVRNGIPISYPFFADDLILYARIDMDQAHLISTILTDFGAFSGHRTRNSDSGFDFILDHIRSKLNGWTSRSLSMVGRIILANTRCFPFALAKILSLVGDGTEFNVWDDTWVPSLGTLRQWAASDDLVDASISIHDLLQENGSWNVELVHTLFQPTTVPHILGAVTTD